MFLQRQISEIKQQNEERLAGERKRQREAVERIRKQTETEIEFLQSRLEETETITETYRVRTAELRREISENKTEKETAEDSLESAREALGKVRAAREEAEELWRQKYLLNQSERLQERNRVRDLLGQLKHLREADTRRVENVSDLNSKLVEKEREIHKLIEENISQIETHTQLTESIRDYQQNKDSVSLKRQKTLDFSVPPDKLKEQLRKTQEENEQSKLYIDKVLSQIMNHCSDLLEIKK